MTSPSLTRFLLVEDEDAHAELVERSMQAERIHNELVRVRDGEEALHYLGRKPPYEHVPYPDVILLDLILPRVPGIEVLRYVRSTPAIAHLPVVIVTTSDSDRLQAEAHELHVNSFVRKPIDIEQFRRMVRDLSLFWGVWNRPVGS